MDIKEALSQIDPNDDSQWTSDGQVMVSTVRQLTGNENVVRKDIINAWPDFNREFALGMLKGGNSNGQETTEAEGAAEGEAQAGAADGPTKEERLAQYKAEREELEAQLLDASRQLTAIHERIKQLNARVGVLNTAITNLTPKGSNQEAIRNYLDRQQKIRQERAEKINGVLPKGVDLSHLNPKSKLDQSLNARPNPAMQRRVRPMVGQ